MFSPLTKRCNQSSRSDRTQRHLVAELDSPLTPATHNRGLGHPDNFISDRPSTGTPAPWAPRLSVLARVSPVNIGENGEDTDSIKPVFVGDFPQLVRDEQAGFSKKNSHPGDASVSGGMDKETCLSWYISGSKLFVWSHLTTVPARKCVVLELPSDVLATEESSSALQVGKSWLISVVPWDTFAGAASRVARSRSPVGIVMCNIKTHAVVYWPIIFSSQEARPVTNLGSLDETAVYTSPTGRRSSSFSKRHSSGIRSTKAGSSDINSLITTPVGTDERLCIAIACSSSGELWQFTCNPTGIRITQVHSNIISSSSLSEGYPRSLIWRFSQGSARGSCRQFFLLTDCEIHCFTISPDLNVSKVWQHEIVGIDGDSGIKKDIDSQKQIWPLDLQVDDQGKVIIILIATICMDRASSSSYTQYSLLTLQHKSEMRIAEGGEQRVLEKQAPVQVIIPKAKVEDKDFLFSMKLRFGGRPRGSAIILSGDGMATVCYCQGHSTRLYKFDLPYDACKVLDASVLSSTDEHESAAWTVLTEKAGVWAIPEKAVVLGGVEPPERSLSRKGSSNERFTRDEARSTVYGVDRTARKADSDILTRGDKGRSKMGTTRQTAHDEESEALLDRLFENFLLTGKVDGSLENLSQSGAFEREGDTNVFARKSKSIVDTLAKHWTTTRGAEILAMTVLSAQLVEKQQKHENFLHFLALSKCHEELCSKQRCSLQIILENGEKLAAMIQLRVLQNRIHHSCSAKFGSPHGGSDDQVSSAPWDLIQLVGNGARQNTVLLMDRDNAEVFYSKVSELEEVFYCLDRQIEYVINADQPLRIQVQRACELSNACITILRTALDYRNDHQMWYPPLEGLIPWHCQPAVNNGLWCITSVMLRLLTEASRIDVTAKSDIYMHLEVLTEYLLEACAGSVMVKLERGEENKVLLDEYWTRRDYILDCLYQQAKEFMEADLQGMKERTEETDEDTFRSRCSNLLSIAKRHEGYKIMWRVCYDLNDTGMLRNIMHESVGPQGGFSYFVFQQLYNMKQFSKLLRLGEEFQDELLVFLKHHPDLLWLHEVFLHQFSSASDTLHQLALAQDEESMTSIEERTVPEPEDVQRTFADRKRFLNLSKIAFVADKDADSKSKVKRIEADLKLLKLQEELTKALPTTGETGQRLFRPEELIEICLHIQSRWLAVKAFEVFAWTSSSFRKNHRSLLEECWRNAVDQDDWDGLYQACTNEGWSDKETLQNLRATALFQASNICYGPQVKKLDEEFAKVLALRRESLDFLVDSESSVEKVLMSHKDFGEAGKLMLTAIMLGSVEDEGTTADDLISPME